VINVPGATSELTCTTSVNKSSVTPKLAFVQVTVSVAPTAGAEQDQPAGEVSDTNVVFAGIASFKVTFSAASGPELLSAIVYVISVLAWALSGQ
jgi:hypothetical protein